MPSEHRARVAAVKAVLQAADLDADTIGWATRVLQGRNAHTASTVRMTLA